MPRQRFIFVGALCVIATIFIGTAFITSRPSSIPATKITDAQLRFNPRHIAERLRNSKLANVPDDAYMLLPDHSIFTSLNDRWRDARLSDVFDKEDDGKGAYRYTPDKCVQVVIQTQGGSIMLLLSDSDFFYLLDPSFGDGAVVHALTGGSQPRWHSSRIAADIRYAVNRSPELSEAVKVFREHAVLESK